MPNHPSPPGSVSRRALLTGTAAVAGIGLTGCGSATDAFSGQTTVKQWNLLAGSDGAIMTDMHAQFMDETGINLKATTFAWGTPFYTKLVMGASGGNAADVATIHLSRLGSLSPDTLLDEIGLDELAAAGLDPEDFSPTIWERCFADDRLYAIPLDTHVLVNYYNRTICGEAGVLNADGTLLETHGVEEYFDLLRAVKDVTGEYGTSLDTNAGWRQFWAWYRQQDGEWIFHEDGHELDDDKALAAIDVMWRMAEEGLCPRISDGGATAANFENGAAGLVQVGNWEIARFRAFDEAQGLDFSMTEMPDFFGNRRTQGDVHSFVLPRHNSWDPEVRSATLEYISWMLQNSFQWGAGAGHTPAYLPVTESPEYQELEPNAEYAGVVDNVQFDPQVWFSGSAARLADEVAQVLAGVYAGNTTPEQALDGIKARAQTLVELPNPID
ncbi:extracellular solute-binding protein [Glycomyces sp. TRM65418]|uniref:extracellular solute-binding protein n=1 Tax=Glycomyces sp. TRM65418 TaxID=2867006 RepID=UPI001CE6BFD2|nr:extracellular solute-binding protein [Glycomyces sp. TRM65418]MCC3762389.1 extracellular solute-binding protein [Glycomyces sp. TRM65418]QZD56435.1 extracellular solute-binding protein [Glycomyces sp. TRM65418]